MDMPELADGIESTYAIEVPQPWKRQVRVHGVIIRAALLTTPAKRVLAYCSAEALFLASMQAIEPMGEAYL